MEARLAAMMRAAASGGAKKSGFTYKEINEKLAEIQQQLFDPNVDDRLQEQLNIQYEKLITELEATEEYKQEQLDARDKWKKDNERLNAYPFLCSDCSGLLSHLLLQTSPCRSPPRHACHGRCSVGAAQEQARAQVGAAHTRTIGKAARARLCVSDDSIADIARGARPLCRHAHLPQRAGEAERLGRLTQEQDRG